MMLLSYRLYMLPTPKPYSPLYELDSKGECVSFYFTVAQSKAPSHPAFQENYIE